MRGEEKPYDLLTQQAAGGSIEDQSCEATGGGEAANESTDDPFAAGHVSDSLIVSKVQTMLSTTEASKPHSQPSVVPSSFSHR